MDVFVLWCGGLGGFKIGLEDLLGFEGLEPGLCGSVPFWASSLSRGHCSPPPMLVICPLKRLENLLFCIIWRDWKFLHFLWPGVPQHCVSARGCGCFGVFRGFGGHIPLPSLIVPLPRIYLFCRFRVLGLFCRIGGSGAKILF